VKIKEDDWRERENRQKNNEEKKQRMMKDWTLRTRIKNGSKNKKKEVTTD
jgi:hypothetical protein